MRIAYITAHFPPDFSSGATLQVERLARAAADLGHDVAVFSGAIGMGLADGEIRSEINGGVHVRWIGTASRVEQDDDGNWDNPLAAAAVDAWLREFCPDVVHVHTLQTLGVGVVDAAVAHGARTVVTMHDMWWWCSRLFLVDTGLRPCPLVTDVGTCSCARNAAWRHDRAERLHRALLGVDRILTPSTALREVIVANGLPPDRITVDPNGIDQFGSTSRATGSPRPPHDGVRLVYIGGDSALKGADVLRAAVRDLDGLGGWTLDAYGLTSTSTLPAPVRLHPPFDAPDLDEVLGDADVLVIPSIARESFSIAAREALMAGLAVISSDCLGPEEVVVDQVNGLIVPTGDHAALAAALRSVVTDSELLDQLHRGVVAHPVEIRSTRDHIESLITVYESDSTTPVRWSGTVAFVVGADGAPARYRAHHPREALSFDQPPGPLTHYLDPDLADVAQHADVVVLQRVPATRDIIDLIARWKSDGKLVVFDTDDLIFDPTLIDEIPTMATRPEHERSLYLDGVRRYRTTLEACDGAIVTTPAIADHVRAVAGVPTAIVPNGLGLVEMRLAERVRSAASRRDDGRTLLGYFSGSDSHQPDLDLVAPVLAELMTTDAAVDLLIVGPVEVPAELAAVGTRVRHVGFQPWQDLPRLMGTVDVNLAPLVLPSRFNEAKSAIKWLEAAAVGVPTVASASSPFIDVIEHGRTGMLCRGESDWREALRVLVDDAALRSRIGAASRGRAEIHHGPHVTAHRYSTALAALSGARTDQARSGESLESDAAIFVAPDERAPSAPVLDVYTDADVADRGLRRWFRRFLSR